MANEDYKSEGGEIGKRGPGRPPKSTAGVNNAADTYTPSVERNNTDQALQPTGLIDNQAGLGGSSIHDGVESEKTENKPFGGKGDHDGDGKPGGATKYFPVLLKRNYRPLKDDEWRPLNIKTHEFGSIPDSDDTVTLKLRAGDYVGLPVDEAKDVIRRGIAERADEIA